MIVCWTFCIKNCRDSHKKYLLPLEGAPSLMPGTRVGAESPALPWTSGWVLLHFWVHWPYHWSQTSWWLDQNFLFSRSWDLSTGEIPETACYFKLSHQFWGLKGTSHAVTLGNPPFESLKSSLLPAFSTLRSILALMLCPWVFRRGHFCPVKSISPSPQALLGKAFMLWAPLLPCLFRCFGGLISALLPCWTLSLHKQLPYTSSGGSTYFRETLTSPSLIPSVGWPSPNVSIDPWDSVQRW